jgi:hypothetical protein
MNVPHKRAAVALSFAITILGACSAADAIAPRLERSCTNALEPPAFRIRMADGSLLPRIQNHYRQPLSNRDSILVGLDDGRRAWLTEVYEEGYCVTALDSAIRHTANTAGYIEVE